MSKLPSPMSLAAVGLLLLCGIVTFAATILPHSRGNWNAAHGGPVQAGFVTLSAGKVGLNVELTGRIAPTLSADVRPQVNGILEERLFREGTFVAAGQPLYRIDQRPYVAALDEAAGALANARANLVAAQAQARRSRSLTHIDALSKQQIDNAVAAAGQARATVQQDEAALAAARINLDWTTIRAPISGKINRSVITAGELLTANQTNPLTTIDKLDPVFVDITQSSDRLLALRRSLATGRILSGATRARLKFEDGSGYDEEGSLEFSESIVDLNTGSVTVRASFPNPHALLLPGMFVRVEVPEGVVPNGILAPQQGIGRDLRGNATALVIEGHDTVAERPVTVTRTVGSMWLVTSGLRSGDKLIVEGTDKVRPGMAVQAVPVTLGQDR